jgi:putative PEP-CTERM system histidine kinase
MHDLLTHVAFICFGLAALAHAALLLGSFSGRGQPSSDIQLRMRLALAATALWGAAEWLALRWADIAPVIAAQVFDLLRYGAWLALLLALLPSQNGAQSGRVIGRLKWGVVAVVTAAAVLSALTLVMGGGADWSRVSQGAQLLLPLTGLLLIEQVLRNSDESARWLAKPVFLGLGCVFVFDTYLYSESLLFGRPDPDAFAIRGAVHALAVPFLWLAQRRSANWSAKLQFSHTAAFYSATLVLAGAYLLFMSALGYYVRYFGGEWGRALQLGLLMVGLAFLSVLLFSGEVRSRLRVFVGKHFYRYRYDYREEWLRFTALLSTQRSPQETAEMVVRGLARLVECSSGSLWTRSSPDGPFIQSATWNAPRVEDTEPADSSLARFLGQAGWVVDLDEFRSSPRRYGELALPNWLLGARNGWLVVPLLAGEHLQGFVVLARPIAPIKLNWEVLDLLKTAGRQAAAYLAQMQAAEALLEARKFDAFNRMSAFVVHDLKNIVAQLSLMLKNAQRLGDNREFQQDMLLTVESSLEKMRRLMLQLREGATPPGGSRGVELAPLAERLQTLARNQGRTLECEHVERVATRGHDERLERVLGHLVQNALEATPAEGRVWLKVARVSGQIKVEVGDTGAGMSEEFIRTRLFRPFNTTKHNGMGIGTFESHQYIRELGGDIAVASRPGQGTTVTVTLPVFETRLGSDLLKPAADSLPPAR